MSRESKIVFLNKQCNISRMSTSIKCSEKKYLEAFHLLENYFFNMAGINFVSPENKIQMF